MKKLCYMLFILVFSALSKSLFAQDEDEDECRTSHFKSTTDEKQFPYDNFFIQRSYPEYGNILPALERAKAIARAQMNSNQRSQNYNLQWHIEGPLNIGGRVNTVAIDPTDSNIIYAGTANGGIFKTTDGGINWASVVDTLSYFAVGDIKIDPTNHNIIYAGLGDPNISGYPAIGNGILKSTDGGATWHNIGLSETRIISKIEIHPLNHNIVYAAAMGLPYDRDSMRGLYKSENGGQTWRQVLFVSDSAGAIDLLLDNTDTSIVYAVSWNRLRQNLYGLIGGPDGKIWKSNNGGNTWAQLTNGLPSGSFSRISIAKSAQNHNTLYAEFVDSASLDLFGIYKSTNAGISWTEINTTSLQSQYPFSEFGWYFGNLTVNPFNENDIYVLGVDLWHTTDNGTTWTMVGPPWYTYELHADKHCLRFLGPNSMIVTTDGGISKSTDGGSNWHYIANLPNTQFYHVSFDPNNSGNYYGGAQDNGTAGGNASNLVGWQRYYGGDGFQQRFVPGNSQLWYSETQYGAIVYTTNGGASFNDATSGINGSENHNWDMPYIISSSNSTTLYTGTTNMYKSTGSYIPNWQSISSDLTKYSGGSDASFHSISTIAESRINANNVYCGTSDGNVWSSPDAGTTWNAITGTLPNRYVTRLIASNVHPNVVFVSHSGYKDNDNIPHVHRSADNGNTWTDISGNLPPFAVNDLELSNLNDSLIFAATDGGVYFTVDMGVNWNRLGTNFPLFQVYDVELEQATGKLLAGTYARSIWSIGVDSILSSFNLALTVSSNDTVCSGSPAQLHASGAASYSWSPDSTLSCNTCADPVATPTVTTHYIVTASSGNASATDTITVYVNPIPTAGISQGGDTLYATGGNSYQWYLFGSPITGATGNFYVATANGDYSVAAFNSFNCAQTSGTITVTNVGFDEVWIAKGLKLYPNPVEHTLVIEKSLPGNWTLIVRDIEGREILRSILAATKTEIDLGNFAGGIYMAQITNGNNSVTKKISKL